MLSKFRKLLKFAPQFFTIIGALSMAFAMLLSVVNLPVMANGSVVNWEGNGSNNLPCVNGVAQWNFSGGQNVTSAVLTVNGQNYGMSQTGGVWKAQVPGLSTVSEAYVTYIGDLGNGNAILTISHCTINDTPDPTNTPVSPTNTPVTPTNTPVTPTNTPVTPTNTPTDTPTSTPTNTAVPDDPTQTPGGPTATNTPINTPTFTPTNTEVPPTATPTSTEVPKDPDPTGTPVTDETPDPTGTPVTDETPDPTEPPVTDETPEPTLAPPVSNDPPTVLIPVTGIELGGNSPLSDVQNLMFNMGLSFLGLGLVLQSVRRRFNF